MSESSLVTYRNLTRAYSRRTEKISKITIHCMAAVSTAKACVDYFARSGIASAQYCIGNDGAIGQSVLECNRAWTSSSSWNDNRAVTIEVSNSRTGEPWPISEAAYKSMIRLCVDICQRNGIKAVNYDGTPNGVLTEHRMYAAKSCPGEYIHRMLVDGTIPTAINKALRGQDELVNATGYNYEGLDYSPVFEPKFYAQKYLDLGLAGLTAPQQLFQHFILCGIREGRQACPTFAVVAYRKGNPDLEAAFDDDLEAYVRHYLIAGRGEIAAGKRAEFM
jgi:hypothetical protein